MEILKDKSKLKTLLEIINKLSLICILYLAFNNSLNIVITIIAALIFILSLIYLIFLRKVKASHKENQDTALEKTHFWVNMIGLFAGMILVYLYTNKKL